MTNRIYTAGHSTRDVDEILAMLQNNEITHLVDFRSFPSSRTFPQWNQPAIIGAGSAYLLVPLRPAWREARALTLTMIARRPGGDHRRRSGPELVLPRGRDVKCRRDGVIRHG